MYANDIHHLINININFMALSRKQKLDSFPQGLSKANEQLVQTQSIF